MVFSFCKEGALEDSMFRGAQARKEKQRAHLALAMQTTTPEKTAPDRVKAEEARADKTGYIGRLAADSGRQQLGKPIAASHISP